MSGLKSLDRNGLFSISSNVKMRGHEIKPVKATFEQEKEIALQVTENKPVELHQRHSEHKEFTQLQREAGP